MTPSASTTAASAATSRIEVRTARLTASMLWVIRTAPCALPCSRTGTAVARISVPRVSLLRVICALWPRSARLTSGRSA